MQSFLEYARQVKSSSNPNAKKVQRDNNLLLEEREDDVASVTGENEPSHRHSQPATAQSLPKYTLNEFMVGRTRMRYYDNSNYLGFPTSPYTSSLAIQNYERLVIHPDIGYYVDKGNNNNNNNNGGSNSNDTLDSSSHSDYTRKYSPQEALNRVLTSPLFNGNNTKTILQSNKSERYYQLTFPLENCGRMYVMAAPMLPCYTFIQPWNHVCRLFQMNPVLRSGAHVVDIREVPQWRYLATHYNVRHAIQLPCNISLMNRRDPVIQEGSIELITTIFTYDNSDADIQFNNPYGCFNKHEDYDGDTNTQSIGKGVESNVEIFFNMKRQMLPCLRSKSIVPQNVLSRIMLYFVQKVDRTFTHDAQTVAILSRLFDPWSVTLLGLNCSRYGRLVRRLHARRDVDTFTLDYSDDRGDDDNDDTERVYAVELLRRVCVCLEHISGEWRLAANKRIAQHIFGCETFANLYLFYLLRKRARIARRLRSFATRHLRDTSTYARLTVDDVRNVLHEILQLWSPISISLVSNCQTLIDDVFRSGYCALGEQRCTAALDRCCRIVHVDFPNFFLDQDIFDLEYIVNVFSRAKGDFDSLLRMMKTVNRYVRECNATLTLERSRDRPLPLGRRDFFTRVDDKLLDKYIDYTDKYVLGSKKIPKSCKQANSMKWAMQNVQYYDGDLWMNGERILHDVQRYFSPAFFIDTNLLDLIVDSMAIDNRDNDDTRSCVGSQQREKP